MADRTFKFKQFELSDLHCGMPVTTDSILLGAWADINHLTATPPNKTQLLDVGTGCGLLALMSAQRAPSMQIDAIEIESSYSDIIQSNFSNAPWAAQIKLIIADFNQWSLEQTSGSYQHIICNPPYFSHGPLADNSNRAGARHQKHLTLSNLMNHCERLLTNDGVLSLIIPIDEFDSLHSRDKGLTTQLKLRRYCTIKATKDTPSKRVLVDYLKVASLSQMLARENAVIENSAISRSIIKNTTIEPIKDELILFENQLPSLAFKQLTKAFYLKF